jgi:hypothetical protein
MYSKPANPDSPIPSFLKEIGQTADFTKKHDNGVHIISPVLTSFLLACHHNASVRHYAGWIEGTPLAKAAPIRGVFHSWLPADGTGLYQGAA